MSAGPCPAEFDAAPPPAAQNTAGNRFTIRPATMRSIP